MPKLLFALTLIVVVSVGIIMKAEADDERV